MKKLLLLLLLSYFSLQATPVNNPAAPRIIQQGFFISPASWCNVRLGYEGNFISNRRLKSSANRIQKFDQFLNAGSATLNFLNRLDLYGVLGGARVKSHWIYKKTDKIFSYFALETKYDLAWAIGGKAIFFEWGNTTLSLGGRYAKTKPKIEWFSIEDEMKDTEKSYVRFCEWQVDLGISYKVDVFIPYVAGKYSKAKVTFFVDDEIEIDGKETLSLKSKDRYGMALGCGLSSSKYFMLNAEVRLFDEEAFTVSGEMKF